MMPYGGIYILGGLSVDLEPIIIKKSIFMKLMLIKGELNLFWNKCLLWLLLFMILLFENWENIVEDWLKKKKRRNKFIKYVFY